MTRLQSAGHFLGAPSLDGGPRWGLHPQTPYLCRRDLGTLRLGRKTPTNPYPYPGGWYIILISEKCLQNVLLNQHNYIYYPNDDLIFPDPLQFVPLVISTS